MHVVTLVSRIALVGLVGGLVACGQSPSEAPTAATPEARPPHPEQALIDDLVLTNRIFVREGLLDGQGHVSVRSQLDPDHYFMPRYVSPGAATASDIIENTLDSEAVDGPRTDQARETHLHGQIYKARPDVMAILHAHTPELVAFGMSSVPLWFGGNPVRVWDIRRFNEGRSGTVQTPQLGRAMAAFLGSDKALLLWGHGVAVTSSSLQALVPEAIAW
jgi:ribulose-5-phosphate 4-epimerase/fuculose-1-phosphate aldolase